MEKEKMGGEKMAEKRAQTAPPHNEERIIGIENIKERGSSPYKKRREHHPGRKKDAQMVALRLESPQ